MLTNSLSSNGISGLSGNCSSSDSGTPVKRTLKVSFVISQRVFSPDEFNPSVSLNQTINILRKFCSASKTDRDVMTKLKHFLKSFFCYHLCHWCLPRRWMNYQKININDIRFFSVWPYYCSNYTSCRVERYSWFFVLPLSVVYSPLVTSPVLIS